MEHKFARRQKGTVPNRSVGRPDYIVIGRDGKGYEHVYRTYDETVLVIFDGAVVWRQDVGGRKDVNDWIAHIRTCRGWGRQHLYDDLAYALDDAITVGE